MGWLLCAVLQQFVILWLPILHCCWFFVRQCLNWVFFIMITNLLNRVKLNIKNKCSSVQKLFTFLFRNYDKSILIFFVINWHSVSRKMSFAWWMAIYTRLIFFNFKGNCFCSESNDKHKLMLKGVKSKRMFLVIEKKYLFLNALCI